MAWIHYNITAPFATSGPRSNSSACFSPLFPFSDITEALSSHFPLMPLFLLSYSKQTHKTTCPDGLHVYHSRKHGLHPVFYGSHRLFWTFSMSYITNAHSKSLNLNRFKNCSYDYIQTGELYCWPIWRSCALHGGWMASWIGYGHIC